MNKFEIVVGSLQISKDGLILLVIPKDVCSIDVLSLSKTTPYASVFNKYLANFTLLFNQPLDNCVDSTDTVFTPTTFIAFAEANLGF